MAKKPRKIVLPPCGKTPRRFKNPASYEDAYFKWRVNNRYIDIDEPNIGWHKVTIREFLQNIVQELHSYENMQWKDIRCKPHCHHWDLNQIPTEFQRRLQEIKVDIDEIFQISLGSLPRIFGHKDGGIFYLIWYDAKHEFWPTEPSNT